MKSYGKIRLLSILVKESSNGDFVRGLSCRRGGEIVESINTCRCDGCAAPSGDSITGGWLQALGVGSSAVLFQGR